MDSTNKVLALFVGLFVVILTIGIGMSRITKNKKPISGAIGSIFSSKKNITPTPTKSIVVLNKNKLVIRSNQTTSPNYRIISNTPTQLKNQTPTEIPQTGAETVPFIVISLALGLFAIKKSHV